MKITIADGRLSFYQWDLNRKLCLEGVEPGMIVQYCKGDGTAYSVETFEENGEIFANVPNAWLQNSGTYPVYIYCENTHTTCKHSMFIQPRPKPDEYVYTETEVLNYQTLSARMRKLEDDLEEQVAEAVGEYLEKNPVEAPEMDLTGVVKTVNGNAPDENGNVQVEGGTVTDEQIAEAVDNYFAENPVVISSVEPADGDIPKVFLTGSEFWNMTAAKNEVKMRLEYISETDKFNAAIKIKFQGNTSLTFPKKNFTIKMYTDDTYEDKLKKNFRDWNYSGNKYVLKANYVDHSHARNIVSANLWSQVVASRPDYTALPEELRNSPRNGAIDGFPVKLYVNGTYHGIYTWNIGKDDWMWGMDEDNANHILMCAEINDNGTKASTPCNFRALWSGTDENHWTVEVGTNSDSVKTALNNLIQFVMDNDGEDFRNGIEQYLDIQSAIDYYLFQYAICGLDGLAKNMLLATYDGKKWICGAYDMDSTFGLWFDGSKFVSTKYACPEEYQETNSLLWERIETNFRDELKSRYAELRVSVLSVSNMFTVFERFMDRIGLDLYAEDLTVYTAIPSGSTNNIKQIRDYIRDRLAYVDAELATMSELVPCTGISLDKSTLTFTAEGTQTLTATVTPDNTTDAITWASNNMAVATVIDGNVTAVGNGDAIITVTCGEYSAMCSVSVSGISTTNILAGVNFNSGELKADTGEVVTSSLCAYTDPVDMSHYVGLPLLFEPINDGGQNNYCRIVFYDDSDTMVGKIEGTKMDTVPEATKYARISLYGAQSSCKIKLGEKNLLLSESVTDGAYVSATGEFNANDSASCHVKFEFDSDVYSELWACCAWGICFFDLNDNFISSCDFGIYYSLAKVTIPDGVASIAVSAADTQVNNGKAMAMRTILIGSIAR